MSTGIPPTQASTSLTGDTTRDKQTLLLTAAVVVMFGIGMTAIGYYYIALGRTQYEAPFQSGWGVILVTMGGLLRELTARGL
jgi:hypothetical protein